MRIGIENILSGMLVKHPNYEPLVVVESVVQDATGEGGAFNIYWRHVGAEQTGGLLQAIPGVEVLKVDDPILREALRGAAALLNDVWEYGGGWGVEEHYKTAAHLIKVRVSALACESMHRQDTDPRLRNEIRDLNGRRDLFLRSLEGSKGGLVI